MGVGEVKQNITPKQLDELSDKGKEKLRGWIWHNGKPRYSTETTPFHSNGDEIYDSSVAALPLLSIGQMIEFLLKETPRPPLFYEKNIIPWSMHWEKKDELCNALWEACKEILND